MNLGRLPYYLPYLNWYIGRNQEMPLVSDLAEHLPLHHTDKVTVVWPANYSWPRTRHHLNDLKRQMARFVPVEFYDMRRRNLHLHERGGFPIPDEVVGLIGQPGYPKGQNDIRGEIFEVFFNDRRLLCAYDYSDYPFISNEVLKQVDLYFKCTAPRITLPSKVINVGFRTRTYRMLTRARRIVIDKKPEKSFDVYGRFGSWTDSQTLRRSIVEKLEHSPVGFVGGFATKVYPKYLNELMRSKIAIELPGQGPISYRLIEAMALGAVVVSPQPTCAFPERLLEGVHYVRMSEDGHDIIPLCREILANDVRRQTIAQEGMFYFDRVFSLESKARRIISAIIRLDQDA